MKTKPAEPKKARVAPKRGKAAVEKSSEEVIICLYIYDILIEICEITNVC